MKPTTSALYCAPRAVIPRIRNAGSWPVFTGNLDNSAPHNAAKRGTNHDLHSNERRNWKMISLPKCRKCGSNPLYHCEEISPDNVGHAFNCSNPECSNDTHWQNSYFAAACLWLNNPCTNMRGGQGDPSDDFHMTMN